MSRQVRQVTRPPFNPWMSSEDGLVPFTLMSFNYVRQITENQTTERVAENSRIVIADERFNAKTFPMEVAGYVKNMKCVVFDADVRTDLVEEFMRDHMTDCKLARHEHLLELGRGEALRSFSEHYDVVVLGSDARVDRKLHVAVLSAGEGKVSVDLEQKFGGEWGKETAFLVICEGK